MGKYIGSFNSQNAIQTALNSGNLAKPYVAWDGSLNKINWNVLSDFSTKYFTLKALESGTFTWNVDNVEYSLNDGTWTAWDKTNGLTVSADDEVRLRATGNTVYHGLKLGATGNFNVEGNSMSLFYGDNFQDKTELPTKSSALRDKGHFFQVFAQNTKVINAGNLILPAKTLNRSYWDMFNGASNLITAPAIQAIELGEYGVGSMFAFCTSLTDVPDFAKNSNVGYHSCELMFVDCTSLEKAPLLPSKNVGYASYRQMFKGCTNLKYVKCLAENPTTASNGPFYQWLNNVAANGTFVKKAGITWGTGGNGIPNGWTVQEV